MKVIAAAIIFTLLSVVSFASDGITQVRDRCGNLFETKERQGVETTVRVHYGNITRTERYEGRGLRTIRECKRNIVGTEEAD